MPITAPTFKRAKRIVALHYGSDTFSTRKLCKLFRNHRPDSPKNELIIQEAVRILELRHRLGCDTSDAGIDATIMQEVEAKRITRNGKPQTTRKLCIACKQPIQINGWQVNQRSFQACPGDCTVVASFYFTANGSKKRVCDQFAKVYGKDVRDLTADVSFDAMLAYMVQLVSHRKSREIRHEELGNPSISTV